MKKDQRVTSGAAGVPQSVETDASTRQRVASSILEHGPSTAAELAERLGLTPAAIRRHLDVLLAAGHLEARERRVYGTRGRGRPAKVFVLTDAGRSVFYTAYDGLAIEALEFLAVSAGPEAVTLFAESRMAQSEGRYQERMANAAPDSTPAQALAVALSKTATSRPHCLRRSVNSCASITAPLPTWPNAFPRSAKLRRPHSPVFSASMCSASPPSHTATVSARLMFHTCPHYLGAAR